MLAAYLLGVILTWTLTRIGRRSAVLSDVVEFTPMSVRTTLMVLAFRSLVQRTSSDLDLWRTSWSLNGG